MIIGHNIFILFAELIPPGSVKFKDPGCSTTSLWQYSAEYAPVVDSDPLTCWNYTNPVYIFVGEIARFGVVKVTGTDMKCGFAVMMFTEPKDCANTRGCSGKTPCSLVGHPHTTMEFGIPSTWDVTRQCWFLCKWNDHQSANEEVLLSLSANSNPYTVCKVDII